MENKTNFDKLRIPLTVVLCFLIFVTWTRFQTKKATQENAQPPAPAPAETMQTSRPVSQSASTPHTTAVSLPQQTMSAEAQLATLENEKLAITFSTHDAAIVKNIIKLSTHNTALVDLETNYLSGYNSGKISFSAQFNEMAGIIPYVITRKGPDHIIFQGTVNSGTSSFTVIKKYILNGYEVQLTVQIKGDNNTGYPQYFYLVNGSSIGSAIAAKDKTKVDLTYLSYTKEDKNVYKKGFMQGSLFPKGANYQLIEESSDWIALDNRFYLKALEPDQKGRKALFYRQSGISNEYLIGAYQVPVTLNSKNEFLFSYLPKSRGLLRSIFKTNDKKFYSIFRQWALTRILSRVLAVLILWINGIIGKMGISIIIMTIIIKVCTLPLQQKSMKSMARMQELSPKINEIKEKHKNNPQKLNQETMALYKKENINPLSGCLPMLIPFPIFIALFSLFRTMIELNGESFLWIANLAEPDRLIALPAGLPIATFNLLPIIMTVASLLQSMTQPQASTDSNQQMALMKYMFPIVFLFICWNMPSALVLYWTVQALFTFLHSLFLKRKKAAAA